MTDQKNLNTEFTTLLQNTSKEVVNFVQLLGKKPVKKDKKKEIQGWTSIQIRLLCFCSTVVITQSNPAFVTAIIINVCFICANESFV